MSVVQWLTVFVVVRGMCALYAPIMDCDETFNYWEPLHYVLFGRGLQTWEYSPEFSLRTYAYIGLNGLLGAGPYWKNGQQEIDKVDLFFLD
mmetsp:Transcript_12705/g.22947  ORF Transcript_12705/g.22947 Transcript_12705/m.22947 type:complete len:91 (+) Transcript_12705:197-469(+)